MRCTCVILSEHMKITVAADMQKRVGGTIDSWCGKCKLVLAHTIEAMVGDVPARVHCNTCNAQHSYKPHAVTPSKRPNSNVATASKNRHEKMLRENKTTPKVYSITERYAPGDVIQHKNFGLGITTAVRDDNKIEVRFESGPKLLVHDRG
jgi:hypothetical protein